MARLRIRRIASNMYVKYTWRWIQITSNIIRCLKFSEASISLQSWEFKVSIGLESLRGPRSLCDFVRFSVLEFLVGLQSLVFKSSQVFWVLAECTKLSEFSQCRKTSNRFESRIQTLTIRYSRGKECRKIIKSVIGVSE